MPPLADLSLFESLCLSAFVFAINEEERKGNDCFKL